VIGQTKALPQLLDQTWQVVTEAWQRTEEPASAPTTGAADVAQDVD
jgi:hypothetical protein